MVPVALAVACVFAAVSTAASSSGGCNFDGPFHAWKSVNGPGHGGYFLRKTTDSSAAECSYVVVPSTTLSEGGSTSYTYGQLENGQMSKDTATVTVTGNTIQVSGAQSVVSGTTTVLFSDYKTCDVMSRPDGNYELWVHSDAVSSNGYGCCDTKFAQLTGGKPIHHTWQSSCPGLPQQ